MYHLFYEARSSRCDDLHSDTTTLTCPRVPHTIGNEGRTTGCMPRHRRLTTARAEWYRAVQSGSNGGTLAKHSSHILELARKGAQHRLEELQAEIAALRRDFPVLAERTGAALGTAVGRTEANVKRTVKRGRTMSAAARKAVSERMTKYWAARRAGKKK